MWFATGLKFAKYVTPALRTGDFRDRLTHISRTNVSLPGGARSIVVTDSPSRFGERYLVTGTGRSLESQAWLTRQSRSQANPAPPRVRQVIPAKLPSFGKRVCTRPRASRETVKYLIWL